MMDTLAKDQVIWAQEDALRLAMLAGEVAELDRLLATDLLFTSHQGQVIRKEDDLAAHRSGLFKINKLDLSEQLLRWHSGLAIVSVRAHIEGSYAGQPSHGDFRFTRVWGQAAPGGAWQVILGHSSLIAL